MNESVLPLAVGEHTVEVLARAGLTHGEINELIARDVAIRALDHAFPRR